MIQQLLGHLDANSRSPASVRAGIVEVLTEAAVIEASGSVGQSAASVFFCLYRLCIMYLPFVSAAGPTVLEVFNTLLRQLRQSVDYQLTGYYDNAAKHETTSAEEKTLQDAVIKTIGQDLFFSPLWSLKVVTSFEPVSSVQVPLQTRFPSTRGQRSCCSSWAKSQFLVSTLPWGRPMPGITYISYLLPFFAIGFHLKVLTSMCLCPSQVRRQQDDPGDAAEVSPPGESSRCLFSACRCSVVLQSSLNRRPSARPQVSERYESSNLLTALPSSFLEPLLSFTLMEDPEIRLLVLSILTSLIDRRRNAARLATARSDFFFNTHTEPVVRRDWFLWVKLGKEHVQTVFGHKYLLKCTGAALWR